MAKLAIRGGEPVRTDPFPEWPQRGRADEEAVARVVRDGPWGVHSEVTRRFETSFAAYCGAKYGVACANGTAALTIALLAAGVEEGAEVIVPPYTFIATAFAPLMVNAVPVFADIDVATGNLDPEAAEAAATPRTQAIIPVHFGGVAADITAFRRIAKRHNLALIEDACHAHGSEYKGRRCGSLGDMAAFSFQSSKNLSSGEGGFVSMGKRRFEDAARAVTHVGRLRNSEWYDHAVLGSNFRLSALQSALLLSQMKRLDKQTDRRDANGRFLTEELGGIEGLHPQRRDTTTRCSHHLFMFRLDPEVFPVPRDVFVKALLAEGIPCSPGYPRPLNRQPAFADKRFGPFAPAARRGGQDYGKLSMPACERLCDEVVWIYQSALLGGRRDMRDIVRAVRKVRDHCGELR